MNNKAKLQTEAEVPRFESSCEWWKFESRRRLRMAARSNSKRLEKCDTAAS